MKLHETILYIEFADFLAAGWKEQAVKMANHRNGEYWQMIKNPSDRRMPMVQFDTLRQKDKDKLTLHFGNPYEYVAKAPIKQMVKTDDKAYEFYLSYRYAGPTGNDSLPLEHVKKYTAAASWLKMLNEVTGTNKKDLKKLLGLGIGDFYLNVLSLLKTENIGLPSTYQRLRNDMEAFKEQGYAYLINARFGNKYAAKVNDELSEALLLELISQPNQHNHVTICDAYNKWANENGYKTIDPATVGNWHRKNEFKVMAAREGNGAWYNTYGKIIHRRRPTAPLLLIGSDDNDLDLYFIEDRNGRPNYNFRFKIIVVMDAFNDYILGYAVGEVVTAELVRAAYLDAAYHMRELTGNWYLPHQLQTDRWGMKALQPFYESLGTYTPATAHVARAKYIEQAFGNKWHQSLKLYPNYAGHNITAAEKTNRDAIERNKKNFPAKENAHHYIKSHIAQMRCLQDAKTGKSRQQAWLDAFEASELAQEKQISDKRFLLLFGTPHTHTNTITNGGLQVTLDGQIRTYDIPDELYLRNVGKTVQVIYEPYNLRRILVTDGKSLHFVASEYDKMSSAIADYAPGERALLNYRLGEKKNHVAQIGNSKLERQERLQRSRMDAESLLQAGVLIKEVSQPAALAYGQSFNNEIGEDDDPLSKL